MSDDLTARVSAIGAALADQMPLVLDAAIAVLESIPPVLDAAHPAHYQIGHSIGSGGMAEVHGGRDEDCRLMRRKDEAEPAADRSNANRLAIVASCSAPAVPARRPEQEGRACRCHKERYT